MKALVGAGSLLISGKEALANPINDQEVKAVNLKIRCTTEILAPPKGENIKIWAPVPSNDNDQEISGFHVMSRFGHEMTEAPDSRNRMLFLKPGSLGAGEIITLTYRLRRKTAGAGKDPMEKPKRHMDPSEWERWDASIKKFADELVGNERDPVKIGRKIYNAIIDRVSYVNEACGRGVSTLTFEERAGRCDEVHALFRSMMMCKGIPVKWEQGIVFPYPSAIEKKGTFEADCLNARSWVSFYIGGNRWMPADLTEAKIRPDLRDFCFGRLPANRVKMSGGRGLQLNPKQEGIINTFPYTYMEADGIPLIYGHHYRNVVTYEMTRMEK